ncbi:MAG: peptidoglycan editing factor PgeF [Oscillospiraceae bacterium]|nr:peptidoglycan editing factor PgeF [Oscillospiraceae bacterium]
MSFTQNTVDNVRFYTSEVLDGVTHAFSTRVGGVSRPPFDTLNLGSSEYDDENDILQNYNLFTSAIGIDPESLVFTKQIHSDRIRVAGYNHRGNGFSRPSMWECDALITDVPGVTLTIFWSDCVPILLYDPTVRAIGAVHAGWRGTAAAIAVKTAAAMVERYGCSDIRAAIGPAIGACCFETDDDVPRAMRFGGADMSAYIAKSGDKYQIDLKGINAWLLNRAGIKHIEVSPLCTCCLDEEFFSHRRSGLARGTQAAVIAINSEQ